VVAIAVLLALPFLSGPAKELRRRPVAVIQQI
jgi:hypothetical protein